MDKDEALSAGPFPCWRGDNNVNTQSQFTYKKKASFLEKKKGMCRLLCLFLYEQSILLHGEESEHLSKPTPD
jgi:hypothetical protein